MEAMLIVRHNCIMDWEKFYNKIIKNKNLIERISSSGKYSWNKNLNDGSPTTFN